MTVESYETHRAPAKSRIERSTSQKWNGSYKIINRYGKPFVNKRVPDSSVVFPGPTFRAGVDDSEIPEECKRLGICDVSSTDKDAIIEDIIKNYDRKNISFVSDVLEPPEIVERIGPYNENLELCESTVKLYAPRLARDSNKEWHTIVNTNASQRQKLRVDICKGEPDAPCASIAIFPDGYTARCVQKYTLREMVALNDNNEPYLVPVTVPNCCSCVAKTV